MMPKTDPRAAAAPAGRWQVAGAATLAVLLTGCSLAPTYERPPAPVPAAWPTSAAAPASDAAPTDGELDWRQFVQAPELRGLIERALTRNRDLRVATLAIEQARATLQVREADQWPALNLAVTGNRQPKTDGSGTIVGTYTAGLTLASWELDFFGRVASLREAALAQYLATREARRAVQTSLVAALASTWLTLQADDELLALAARTRASREDSLRLVRLRLAHGAASALELRQAESLAAAARAAEAQQERLRAQDLHALALLVGEALPEALTAAAPGALARDAQPLPPVPAGLPSTVLLRRPDVLQAEHQLVAANASIGAARAAFLPRITLTAGIGTASNALSGLFREGSWGFTLAPQALLTVFDAGRNQASLDAAQAAREIAVAQYEKAIQTAFREVADALAAGAALQTQLTAQTEQARAEAARAELAELRERHGVANALEVLDARRSLLAAQQAVVATRLALQQSRVALFKALGGGAPPA